jgi:membrane-bound lytic murein transglycosylase F
MLCICILSCARNPEPKEISGNAVERISFDLEQIKKRGKIVLLAENSTVSYFIYRGKKMGYEYELIKEFAEHLGVELEVKMIDDLDKIEELLNNGDADLVACNYTVTQERAKRFNFSVPHSRSAQVLVQRRPDNWRRMKKRYLDTAVIRDPIELIGKEIHVWNQSSFQDRLTHLSEEIGGEINIVGYSGEIESEEFIRMVSKDSIDYTVTDGNLAKIAQRYYPNIDIELEVSVKQQIAFGVRKNAPNLLKDLNAYINEELDKSTFRHIYRKYFEYTANSNKAYDKYSSVIGGKVSPFDKHIKVGAKKIGWDWTVLASLIYKESKFKKNQVSWAGAYGVMQFMPEVGPSYGVYPNSPIPVQINGGVTKLTKNYKQWLDLIPDSTEAMYFTLATYNAGLGHVQDARRLAEKFQLDPNKWFDNVDLMILNLMKSKYYKDPVVQSGYCRGSETYDYVHEIMQRSREYQTAFSK